MGSPEDVRSTRTKCAHCMQRRKCLIIEAWAPRPNPKASRYQIVAHFYVCRGCLQSGTVAAALGRNIITQWKAA